jgi:light-regulated signal transduction histidine kinase (bacteriophytochrome)
MEVYKAAIGLRYQSNFTDREKIAELTKVGSHAVVKPGEKKTRLIVSVNEVDRLNYIEAIETQNEKLKEISWIQSHLVRGPLARIMGLINIINGLKDNRDMATVLEYLSLSANELDLAIRQITEKSTQVLV